MPVAFTASYLGDKHGLPIRLECPLLVLELLALVLCSLAIAFTRKRLLVKIGLMAGTILVLFVQELVLGWLSLMAYGFAGMQ
jgi:hypothetical protein